jgi:hypothetical protein
MPCSLDGETVDCVHSFIDDFGAKAFRRPLEADEHWEMFELYQTLDADPEVSRELAVASIVSARIARCE